MFASPPQASTRPLGRRCTWIGISGQGYGPSHLPGFELAVAATAARAGGGCAPGGPPDWVGSSPPQAASARRTRSERRAGGRASEATTTGLDARAGTRELPVDTQDGRMKAASQTRT